NLAGLKNDLLGIYGRAARTEIRAENRRFLEIMSIPQRPVLRREGCPRDPFFSRTLSLSKRVSGLISSRLAYYRHVWGFSIRVFSPWNQRDRSCSRNCGFRFENKADNGRFIS